MSVGSMAKDFGNSIIGNPKKAVLIFGTGAGASSSASTAASGGMALMRMTSQKLNNDGLSNTSLINTATAKHLEVQYNPASIQFMASVEAIQMRNMQNSLSEGVVSQSSCAPSVIMSVDLIFNAVNPKDSFMADKLRVSANDVITTAAWLAKSGKGAYTVQPQSNGLIASTIDETDRFVTFQWADMSFSGELTDVSVQYGMFSVSGKPVHSVVTLRIVQQLNSSAEDTKWNLTKFNECFSGKQNTSIGQKMGNLLNITGF